VRACSYNSSRFYRIRACAHCPFCSWSSLRARFPQFFASGFPSLYS